MGAIKFKRTNIAFIVDSKGVATICTVTHATDNGEKKAVVTLPGERFSYRTSQPRKARENH